MYESPIEVVFGEIQNKVTEDLEGLVYQAVQNVHVNVDKEELIKALQYDRNQYEKGYKDGYEKAIDEFVNLVNQCSGYTENCIEHDLSLTIYTIHQIAEEMRGAECVD